ncbi:MAG: TetR/AcrR family transcriptional regulator C-terminal domain-containing protein [Stackebrandtia sp.]
MPRQTLTKGQVVTAAIALLDEAGLDGLNMRALGTRLDSAATAVYWHVENKDNLVRLAADEIWNEIELPDLDELGWREAAAALAHGLWTMISRHPWLAQAIGSHLLYGPGQSRFDDHSLAVYEKAGFTGADADRAAATVHIYVLGNTLGMAANISLTRRLSRGGVDPEKAMSETMAKAAKVAEPFPRLRTRIQSTAASEYFAAPEGSFEFGLTAILDGLEKQLGSRPAR